MRCVFVTVGAFLGRIDGATRCAFWADEPVDHGFDPARLITVDLALTPSAAAAGEIDWDAVQVDDCYTGAGGQVAGTTLGPRWPEIQTAGVVLLEQRFYERLPAGIRPPCPPPGLHGRAYEYMSLVYAPHIDDARAGQRYAGHHARVVEERGSLAKVLVHAPGTSQRPGGPTFALWLDLAVAEHCDAGPGQLTAIGVGDAPKSGALFLHSGGLAARRT